MKNLLTIVALVLFILLNLTACAYNRGIILFNTEPVTKHNMLKGSKSFNSGAKIYYIFLAPEKMKNEFIRVQIFKTADNVSSGGHDVVRTKDCRLMLNERYYYSDYFVLHEKGRYVMQVFPHSDFQHPLALNDFYIQ